jgi:lambda family phage tail tape measure protein
MSTAQLDINIRSKADTSGLDAAQRSLKNLSDIAKALDLSQLTNLVSSFTVGNLLANGVQEMISAIAQVPAAIHQVIDLGDQLGNLSDQTGQSIQDLVLLKQAFKNSGLGDGAVAQNLNLFQRARTGFNDMGQKTTSIFKYLGVNLDNLQKQTAVQQFQTLADAFQKVQNPAERSAIAMDLFGRSGAQMLALFRQDNVFQVAAEQVGSLGQVMQQNADTFNRVSNAWGAFSTKSQQFFLGIALQAVPAIDALTDAISKLDLIGFGQNVEKVFTQFPALGNPYFAQISAAIDLLVGLFDRFKNTIYETATAIGGFFADLVQLPFFNLIGVALATVGQGLQSLQTQVQEQSDLQKKIEQGDLEAIAQKRQQVQDALNVAVTGSQRSELENKLNQLDQIAQKKIEGALSDKQTVSLQQQQQDRLEKIFQLETQILELRSKGQDLQASLLESQKFNLENQDSKIPQDLLDQRAKAMNDLAIHQADANGLWDTNVTNGLNLWVDSFGSTAHQVATTITGTLGTAISGIAQGITGLITDTTTWGQAMLSIVSSIIEQFIQLGIQMVVNSVIGRSQQAASTASIVAGNQAIAASAAPAAAGTSIATFGSSAVIGAAAAALAIGTIIGLLVGGFEEGGLIPGAASSRDNRIASVATGEYVNRSSAVSYYGPGFFDALNSMSIPRSRAMELLGGISVPRYQGTYSFATGGLATPVAASGGRTDFKVNIAMVNSRAEMTRFMQKDGKKIAFDYVSKKTTDLGES